MQYQGGKSRISKNISEVISEVSGRQIENSNTNSRNDNGISRNRQGGEHLLVYFVEAVQLKARLKALIN